jgi:hypothetical protein
MTPDQINDMANFIVLLCAIPYVAFSLTYGTRDHPWGTYLGVIMWGQGTSLALVFLFIISRRWFGEYWGYEWVAVILYSSLTAFAWLFYGIYLVERRRSPIMTIPLTQRRKKESKMTDTTKALIPPDIWYKAQRVLRTIVSTVLSLLSVWAIVALVAPDVLAELAKILPASWVAWLAGVIASITAVAAVLTRIMAIPKINELLTKIGLGSVPQSALMPARTVEGGQVHVITTVKPDPKAVLPADTRDTYRDRNAG